MLGIIFFIFCCAAAFGLLRLLPLRLTLSDQIGWSIVSGVVLGSWLGFLCAWAFGYQFGIPLSIGVIVVLLGVGYKLPTRMHTLEPELPADELARTLHGVLIMLLCAFFGYLALTHFFEIHIDGWYSSGYTWSDLALHGTLISNFADQSHFSWVNPIFAGGKLSYPFLMDFFSGIMLRLGSSWQMALVIPTFSLLIALFQLFLSFTRRLLGSARAAWIHLGLFVLSGSPFGLYYVYEAVKLGGWSALLTDDFSIYQSGALSFGNIVTSHLLPQRGFLLGFATALLVLQLCRIIARNESVTKILVWVVGGLVGLLPFIHVHTFMVLFGLLLILLVTDVAKNRSLKTPWGIAVVTAFAVALPQLTWQFSSSYGATFGHWHFGWMMPADTSIGLFWLKNIGVVLVFLIGNYFVYQRYMRDQFVWQLYLLSVLIFIAVNVRIFQPNDFDNMKLLIYSYWGITLGVAYALSKWTRVWWGTVIASVLFLSLTLNGALVLARETQIQYREFSTEDVAFIDQYKLLVPENAVVLDSSVHNNPVSVIGGRRIVMGYPGWLWSYGINYAEVETDTHAVWWGTQDAARVIQKYGITHVVFNDDEVRPYGINLSFMSENYTSMYHGGGWNVYKVR